MIFPLQPADEVQIRRQYPLSDIVDGWYFKVEEVSVGVFQVEGTDLYGRKVQRTGINSETLLKECARDAAQIQHRAGEPFNNSQEWTE